MKAILCFGDSITHGRGEMPNLGWVGRLKNHYEPQNFWNCVYNLGIPGETTFGLLKRFDSETRIRIASKRQDKYIIVVSTGINDTCWDGLPEENNLRVSEKEFDKNIKELIIKAKVYSADLVFIGLTPVDEKQTLLFENTSFKNDKIKQFNEIIKNNCSENNVLFLDFFDILNNSDWPMMLADGVHPNSKGYDLMFEQIKLFLIEGGLIK
jgi:acyl-CoA thioesterase I